ncbi:MAG: hypothetical protein UT34_C0001G0145 [candidate division WS6 bacterium GW2011_GWF2_39_15]|uniref:Uncharacterized protein n=1 Tax=candidate division WS6 bacterium GW2011_GWF2_39_15 TaxID=1619100 RepID=A0A0G0Q6T5_9BACT|nr:MAG: hypothetical protein UT34_C0001G0145 [candidate division WS6 bacterium GW2011_GWF2_39_15]
MSLRSCLSRFKEEKLPFSHQSYSTLKLGAREIVLSEIMHTIDNDTERRIRRREYIVDKAKYATVLYDKTGKSITTSIIRDLFHNIGFNTDTVFGEPHNADVTCTANIGGYIFPFWRSFIYLINKSSPTRILLTQRLGPGRKRLHVRLFNSDDGSWIVITHVDHSNWFNFLDPIQSVKSHFVKATGDYELGNKMLESIITQTLRNFDNQKHLHLDINQIYLDNVKQI